MKNGMKTIILLLVWLASAISVMARADMAPMSNSEMASVNGQGLLVAETIAGKNVTSGLGTGDWTSFTYTRMGLNAVLNLNANIDKFQLGCGGLNEAVKSNACDIDMDFVRFMGLNGTQPCSVSTTVTDPCYGGGDFKLVRPYIEIATKGTGAAREIAGIKIGAQTTTGYFGVGRNYAQNATNLENGGTCSGTSGTGALNCHSGINNISGYMHTELSATMQMTVLGSTSTVCFGRTTVDPNCPSTDPAYFTDIVGTRVNFIDQQSIPLKINGGLASLFGSGYAWITEDLRMIHGFSLDNTSDFGLSFQREKLSYPGYDKTNFSYPANAGWWMNVPYVASRDIQGPPLSLGLGAAISALSAPGYHLINTELNSTAPANCWGSSKFC